MTIEWRKSGHSQGGTGGGDCVELARLAGAVAIRDSKAPSRGHLTVSPGAFATLLEQIKRA